MVRELQYQYPPDYDKAHKHRMARRIFKGHVDESKGECQCCQRRIGEEVVETECNINPKQLSFLGPGVPLFFLFLKSVIILLILMTLIFAIFGLYSNFSSSDCSLNTSCKQDGFNELSIVNKEQQQNYLSIQNYLALAYIVVAILFFHYFRAQARKLQQECDEIIDSPSDYAIVLKRLQAGVTQEDILNMIESRRKDLSEEQRQETENLKVVKIILSYYLRPLVNAKEKRKQGWKKAVKDNTLEQWQPEELPKPENTSQIAIVIFQHQATKDLFIHKPTCSQSILQFFCTPCQPMSGLTVKGQQVGIERAPQPDEIYWQNSGITMEGSICRKVGFGIISILILLVGGMAQYGLAILNKQATTDLAKNIFLFANPVIVMVWNTILMIAIVLMTERQRNETITQFQAVLVVKITLVQFLNAGVFVVLTKIIANFDTFTIGGGIVNQITTIMILNAITPNLVNFAKNYFEILNKISLCFVKKGCCIKTQSQVNQLTAGNVVNIPRRYAYILKTLLLTALYAPTVPIVVPIALVGMIIFYFVQKILYTHSYAMPHTISSMTFKSSVELLEYFLITFALGQFIIYAYFYSYQVGSLPTNWLIVIFISLGLALLNSALPMEVINQKLFDIQKSSRSQLKYSQIESQFQVTYEMFNPAYKCERTRNNNKDRIRELLNTHKVEDTSDMIDIMNMLTAQNQGKQPLLGNLIYNLAANTPVAGQSIEMELMKTGQKDRQSSGKSRKLVHLGAFQNDNHDKPQHLELQKGEKDSASMKKGAKLQQKPEEEIKKKMEEEQKRKREEEEQEKKKKEEEKRKKQLEDEEEERKKREQRKLEQSRFRHFQVKEVKNKQKNSYSALISRLMSKKDLTQKQTPIQTSLIHDVIENPKIQQNHEQELTKRPLNHSSHLPQHPSAQNQPQGETGAMNNSQQLMAQHHQQIVTFQQLAFPQPEKQKLATYDPIGIKEGYKKFFNNPDKMMKKQGNYLNSKLVVEYIGTPFTSLLKGMEPPKVQKQQNQRQNQK